jgi:hypothetical protein
MALNKIHNGYAAELGDVFAQAPKAVIAAVAVSALTLGGDCLDEAQARFLAEWQVLFDNGIVPQKPPRAQVSA